MKLLMSAGLVLALACGAAADDKAELGKVVPDLTLKSIDGKDVKLTDFRKSDKNEGKIVVVVFWSYKCPSGKAILGDVKDLADKCEKAGIAFVGVCAYGETADEIKDFAKKNEIKYTLAHDSDKSGAKLFSAGVVTSSFVLDKEGKLVYKAGFQGVWDAASAAKEGKEIKNKDTKARG